MSEDTGSSTEAASVSNGSGLSMIHMRGGLFGKSAATLNDEDDKALSTSIVSGKDAPESSDNKLCNDEKCDEAKKDKEDVESQSKLDDSARIANEEIKSSESHSDEKENANSGSIDDQQANTSVDNLDDSVETTESASVEDNAETAPSDGSEPKKVDISMESQGDEEEAEVEQQEEPDSTTPEQLEEDADEGDKSKQEELDDSQTGEPSDENAEDSPKEMVPKSAGRRGRPPKSKAKAEPKQVEEKEETSTPRTLRTRNTEVSTPMKSPKSSKPESTGKRGRPPKMNKVVSSPMSTNARRGRKKREDTEELSEKSETEEEPEQEAAISANVEAEVEPEEEMETEPEPETSEVVDSDDEVEEPKKTRRGAPKKTPASKTPGRSVGRPKRNANSTASVSTPVVVAKADTPAKGAGRRPSRRVSAVTESTSTPKKLKGEVKIPASAPPARKVSKLSQKDPYDFSPEQETPPVFFKNIEMKLQSFGDVTYSRVGTGKYENTEKAAEARVSNLADLVPAQKSKKTLAELTPRSVKGKKEEKQTPVTKVEPESPNQVKTPKGTPGRKRKQGDSIPTSSPKKVAVLAPVLDDREQWVVDHPDDDHLPYEAGARVYAVFNKVLYPAVVLNSGKDSLGRYKVQYVSDKVVKDVPNEGVIPLRALVADKQCVAQVDSDWMEMQILQSPKVDDIDEWKQAIFTLAPVDEDDKAEITTDKFPWTSINLDSSDWKDYISKKSREVTEVLVDNISAGDNRTSRRSRGTEKMTSYPSAKPTGVKKAKLQEDEPMDTTENYEDPPREKFEPIFSGKIFILTSAQRGSDATGFKKKLMSEFIEQCHGVVVEDFMAVEDQRELEPFLISDTCYRTHKYLSALARGIPCVSHEWIEKCREAKSLVDFSSYLLPAGKSILDEQMYPLPKNQRSLLKDKVVLVHSTNRPATPRSLNFYQIWQPMVSWLGGTPLNEMPKNMGIIDFILADNTVSPELIEMAIEKGISIASSEWVIQAIIMDKLPNLDSHPRFRYDVTTINQP